MAYVGAFILRNLPGRMLKQGDKQKAKNQNTFRSRSAVHA
jgi:hypothetical protein